MHAVAEVVPPKEREKMSAITSATVTARYEPATGKTHVKVDAVGDEPHGGISLVEFEPRPGCYRDGQVLCVEVKFAPDAGKANRWASEETPFNRSADFVVVVYGTATGSWVLTARPVEKADRIPSRGLPDGTPLGRQADSKLRRRRRKRSQ
jgi:hypothetical protein